MWPDTISRFAYTWKKGGRGEWAEIRTQRQSWSADAALFSENVDLGLVKKKRGIKVPYFIWIFANDTLPFVETSNVTICRYFCHLKFLLDVPLRSIFPINLRKLCVIFLNLNVRVERATDLLLSFSNSFFPSFTIKTLKFLIENSSKIDLKISGEGKCFARLFSLVLQQSCNEMTRLSSQPVHDF